MGVYPGPNGMPEEIWKTREDFFNQLKLIK